MGSIVDIQALRGYDSPAKLENKVKKLKQLPSRFCATDGCKVKLSIYNDTEWCSRHQKDNLDLPKHF